MLPRSVAATFTGPALNLRPFRPAVRRTVMVCVAAEFHEPRVAVLAVRDAVTDAVHRIADRGEWPGITPAPR